MRHQHQVMKSLRYKIESDVRSGIERWENEGGRIRFGWPSSSPFDRLHDADHRTWDAARNFREADLSVHSNESANFLSESKEQEKS